MDITPLLAPISTDQPCGADLAFSNDIDAILEMRREDDPTLAQGEWITTLKTADWLGVARSCENLLTHRTKDMRVAGWLADAWGRLRGLEGMADGLGLMAGLIENHWDSIHPLPDDNDPEQRIGSLRWLIARVEQLVPTMGLLSHDGRHFSLVDIAGARARRLAGGGGGGASASVEAETPPVGTPLTLEMVWRYATEAGPEAARERRARVVRARASLVRLQFAAGARLDEQQMPSFVAVRIAFDRALDEVARLERECRLQEQPESVVNAVMPIHRQSVEEGAAPASYASAAAVTGRIESRGDALEQLRMVSAFFRATEPHSPVAYLIDKAVNWAELPLHAWLRAVVKDEGSLAHLEEMLGVDPPPTNA